MSMEKARAHLASFGLEGRIQEFTVSSATVGLAAEAVGCEPARIAKTLSFENGDGSILVVAAGDAKVDNRKFKDRFGRKAKMLSADEVEARIGHGVRDGVEVYTDASLQRFDTVYPAAGTAASAVRLSCEELYEASGSRGWVDVCKGWG